MNHLKDGSLMANLSRELGIDLGSSFTVIPERQEILTA